MIKEPSHWNQQLSQWLTRRNNHSTRDDTDFEMTELGNKKNEKLMQPIEENSLSFVTNNSRMNNNEVSCNNNTLFSNYNDLENIDQQIQCLE